MFPKRMFIKNFHVAQLSTKIRGVRPLRFNLCNNEHSCRSSFAVLLIFCCFVKISMILSSPNCCYYSPLVMLQFLQFRVNLSMFLYSNQGQHGLRSCCCYLCIKDVFSLFFVYDWMYLTAVQKNTKESFNIKEITNIMDFLYSFAILRS